MRAILRRERKETGKMRPRAIVAVTAIAAASLVAGGSGAAAAQASTTCTWGGTPANPTGKVWYTGQGVTNTPSTEPLPFIATGPLAGGCSGTLTYRGYQGTGSTCAFGPFEARATGLPGVVRAAGDNAIGLVPALLYDTHGNVVGSENPQVLTSGTEEQNLGFASCNSPEGFKEGNFSSVIELLR
jgi:hypothetical protein